MKINPDQIIEITSLKQLMEMSSMGGGNAHGHAGVPFGKRDDIEKFNEDEKEAQRLKGKKLSEQEKESLNETSFQQYNPGGSSSNSGPLSGTPIGRDANDPHGAPKTWLPQNVIRKFNANEKKQQFHSTRNAKKMKLTEEEKEMIKREDIIVERKLRMYIRDKIKKIKYQQLKAQMLQEMQLRQVIRTLLKEGDISDIHPHRSTGINILEDLLKKMIPTLRTDFKRLTTDESQRKSFRAHMVKAIRDALLPSMVNSKYLQTLPPVGGSGALMAEPAPEPEEPEEIEEPEAEEEGGDDDEEALAALEEDQELQMLDELDIDVADDGDEEKKLPIEDDDTPSEEEAFGAGLEGLDETGRNMAFACFKKVSQYILDAYDSLANPKDKEIFVDYLVTNVKLYFDKFEDELQKNVEEPSTDEYESAKTV
jgi:hypothetical protein